MQQPVLILTTGGTIDKIYFDAKSVYSVGEPQIKRILQSVGVLMSYTIETVMRKDSLDMTADDRAHIRHRIMVAREERILITHGTDTMIETARVLLDVPGKTIVVVGSLKPACFKATDAEFNIGFACAAVQTLPHGVFLAMNGRLFDPLNVEKNLDENCFEDA